MSDPASFFDGRVKLYAGDCLEILKTISKNSIDSVVTDPPYHLTSIVKRFGAENAAPCKEGKTGAYARASRGFMGKQWDGGDIAFRLELWAEVFRVLKPGGHVLALSATRTYHRMACAIEDAGFEVRDMTAWVYGSGFPKSHDVSKAVDKYLGAERTKVRVDAAFVRNPKATGAGRDAAEGATRPWFEAALERGYHEKDSDVPASEEAEAWQGWGTALKPALEPICLARKPLFGTVAENVLTHGTGALNIDGCRVGVDVIRTMGASKRGTAAYGDYKGLDEPTEHIGRWPANLIHDGSPEVVAAFPQAPGQQRAVGPQHGEKSSVNVYGDYGSSDQFEPRFDSGSAARFFYSAKADADDRLASKHPTVKPVDLMQYLVRLVTPPNGTVLDPFAGTGTTGEAAWREGFSAILCEREEEYRDDIARRMSMCLAGPDERSRTIAKIKHGDVPAGPLFEGIA